MIRNHWSGCHFCAFTYPRSTTSPHTANDFSVSRCLLYLWANLLPSNTNRKCLPLCCFQPSSQFLLALPVSVCRQQLCTMWWWWGGMCEHLFVGFAASCNFGYQQWWLKPVLPWDALYNFLLGRKLSRRCSMRYWFEQ